MTIKAKKSISAASDKKAEKDSATPLKESRSRMTACPDKIGIIKKYGCDILSSPNMQLEKDFVQHGDISTFEHSVMVAYFSLRIASFTRLRIDARALVRGSLLHDYFLYDWHEDDPSHSLHGFHHAKRAAQNASRDFELNPIEHNIIKRHMFPLNITPPRYRESTIVCLADKFCAVYEMFKKGSSAIYDKCEECEK